MSPPVASIHLATHQLDESHNGPRKGPSVLDRRCKSVHIVLLPRQADGRVVFGDVYCYPAAAARIAYLGGIYYGP